MNPELQVGVKIILKNKEGHYLLLKRSPKTHKDVPEDERWEIPGGRIQPGIPLEDGLHRELQEETQLKLTCKPKLIATHDIFPKGKHVVRLTYIADMEGEPVLGEEHTEYAWVPYLQLKSWQGLCPYVQDVVPLLEE